MKRFYYSNSGSDVNGPIGESDVKALYQAGALSKQGQLCEEGTEEWVSASSYFTTSRQSSIPPIPTNRPVTSKGTEDEDEKIRPSSWALGCVTSVIASIIVFGPIFYFVSEAESSGKIEGEKWMSELLAYSLIGFLILVTGGGAAFFHGKRRKR